MRNIKNIFLIVLIVFVSLFFSGCTLPWQTGDNTDPGTTDPGTTDPGPVEPEPVYVETIELTNDSLLPITDGQIINVDVDENGYEIQLIATAYPENADNTELDFNVDMIPAGIATMSDTGLISITGEGTINITVESADAGDAEMGFSVVSSYVIVPQITPTELVYNEAERKIEWSSDTNVSSYEIEITNLDTTEVTTETVFTNNFDYGITDAATTIRIKALGNGIFLSESEYSTAIDVKVIAAPFNLAHNVVGGESIISWDAATNIKNEIIVDSYLLTINGIDYSISASNQNNPSFNASDYLGANLFESAGDYDISIKNVKEAVDTYLLIDDSIVTVTKLAAPTNTRFENSLFNWNANTSGTGYEIEINGIEETIADPNTVQHNFLSGITSGAVNIRVRTLGDNTNTLTSAYSGIEAATKMAAPVISVVDGEIAWEIISGATDYILIIDSEEVSVASESDVPGYIQNYILDTRYSAGVHNIEIIAEGDGGLYLKSDNSLDINVTKLAKPTTFAFNTDSLSWVSSADTTAFTVDIESAEYTVDVPGGYVQGDTISFDVTSLVAEGENNVKIKAKAPGYIYSDYVVLPDKITKLSAPELTAQDGIIVWTQSQAGYNTLPQYATYELVVGADTPVTGITANSYILPESYGAGTYELKLKLSGDPNSEMASEYSSILTVTKLAAPTNYGLTADVYLGAIDTNVDGLMTYTRTPLPSGVDEEDGVTNRIISYKADVSGTPGDYTYTNELEIEGEAKDSAYIFLSGANGQRYAHNIKTKGFNAFNTIAGEMCYYLTSNYTSTEINALKVPYPTNITMTNGVLSWDSDYSGTLEYWVVVDDLAIAHGDGLAQITRATDGPIPIDVSLTTSSTSVDFSGYAAGSYKVYLITMGNATEYIISVPSSEYEFSKLSTPTNLSVDNGIVSWDPVLNATGYTLSITDGVTTTTETLVGTDSNKFIFTDNSYLLGTDYTFTVKANGNGANFIDSEYSVESVTAGRLATVDNISIVKGQLQWDAVANATNYIVAVYTDSDTEATYIGTTKDYMEAVHNLNGQLGYIFSVDSNIEMDLPPEVLAGEYYIKIYAVEESADGSTLISLESARYTAVKLPAVSNLEVANAIIIWSQVGNASGYKLYETNSGEEVNYLSNQTLSQDITALTYYEPGDFKFKILTLGYDADNWEAGDPTNTLNSTYTAEIDVTFMAAPATSVSTGIFSWAEVFGADEYEITIRNTTDLIENVITGLTEPFYVLDDTYPVETYEIKVRAIGDNSRYITSEYGPFDTVEKLAAPTGMSVLVGKITFEDAVNELAQTLNYTNDNITYEITVKNQEESISDSYNIEGDTITEIPADIYPAGVYYISVKVIGNNDYYITSDISASVEVTILDTVTNVYVADGVLCWDANSYASEYLLNLNEEIINVGSVTSYDLSGRVSTDYSASIKAIGTSNSDNLEIEDTWYLNSDYTTSIDIVKLPTPTSFVNTNGVLTWDVPLEAEDYPDGYTLILNETDGSDVIIGGTELIITGVMEGTYTFSDVQLSVGKSYTLSMYNTGNSTDNINSDISIIIRIEKLAIPQNLAITAGSSSEGEASVELAWDAVTNADSYILYVEDEAEVVTEYTSATNTYSLSGLDSEIEYTITVAAIGVDTINGAQTAYLLSERSDAVIVTLPTSPQNVAVNNGLVTWDTQPNVSEYLVEIVFDSEIATPVEISTGTDNFYYFDQGQGYYYSVKVSAVGTISNVGSDWVELTETLDAAYIVFTPFADGAGTDVSPYEIDEVYQLEKMSWNPTADYVLTATTGLDLSGSDWTPLFDETDSFTGSFNGNGYDITGLTISSAATHTYSGLFGYVGAGATIENFTLSNVSLASISTYVGSVAGVSYGDISNVTVSGTVQITPDVSSSLVYVGSIAGQNHGNITSCTNNATVGYVVNSIAVQAGGIAGINFDVISWCDNNGNITGNYTGGIAGFNSASISNCNNTGDVTSTTIDTAGSDTLLAKAGGIAGSNGSSATILTVDNTGNITATSTGTYHAFAAGIAGENDGTVTSGTNSGTILAVVEEGFGAIAFMDPIWN